MIVLGIDPGTAITGYGVVCTDADSGLAKSAQGAPRQNGIARGAPRLMECGVIRTSPRAALASRLHDIFEGVTELIERHKPDALAVEDVFFARNVRTTRRAPGMPAASFSSPAREPA